MGCSTVDIQGLPLTLVIPHESVSDPLLSDSLVSAGSLMEAGFEVIFRLPQHADTDGFQPHKYPMYGGTIVIPNPSRTIVIEYRDLDSGTGITGGGSGYAAILAHAE